MTDANYRHLTLIVDRSGSMAGVASDMNGGISMFMSEQAQLPKRTTVSLYQFDTHHDEVLSFAPLTADVLGDWKLVPRGMTALHDAVGTAIQQIGAALDTMPEDQRPTDVIIMIVTDGFENSSKEYTLQQIHDMITRQREQYGWVFMFLGADQDAFKAGAAIGVPTANTSSYASSATSDMFDVASTSVKRGAGPGGQSVGYTFTPEEVQRMNTPKGDSEPDAT